MTTKQIRVISILDEFWLGNPHGGERREDTISVECSDCSDNPGSTTLTLPLWRDMHEQYGYSPERVVIDGHTYQVLNAWSTYYYEDTPFVINVGADLCKDPSPVIEVYYKRWGEGFVDLTIQIGWPFKLPPTNVLQPDFKIETYIQVYLNGVQALSGTMVLITNKIRKGTSTVVKASGRVIKNQRFGFSGCGKRTDTFTDTSSELRLDGITCNTTVTIPAEDW